MRASRTERGFLPGSPLEQAGTSNADRRAVLRWTLASLATAAWTPAYGARLDHEVEARLEFVIEPGSVPNEFEGLVQWIVVTPRERVLERAVREVARGLDPTLLLGATFIAAAREVRPDGARFNHAALVVSSIDQMTSQSPAAERLHLVLWGLDNFKAAQQTDARDRDWRLEPYDEKRVPSPDRARAELTNALERWDAQAADAAIAGFARSTELREVFELVWEFGTRCQSNIGHKAIYCAMAHRALPLAGERGALDALRSLVAAMLDGSNRERAAPFESSRAIVDRGLAAEPGRAIESARATRELRDALRRAKPGDAPELAAQFVRSGAERSSLWDGLAQTAAEVFAAQPGVGPLHALTSLNALHYIARSARTQRVRDLALLQAAAWLCFFRDSQLGNLGGDELPRWEPTGELDGELTVRDAREAVFARASDAHDVKFAAAVIEEIALAGPQARKGLLAALPLHRPPEPGAESDAHQRIREALATQSKH